MTDVHDGKETAGFNQKSLAKRLDAFAAKVAGIHGLLGSGYEFDELVLCLLGDVVDGTGIYPTQAHHQERTSVIEQIDRFADKMAGVLRTLGGCFPRVRVECIPGNHGRVSKFADENDNWDVVAYEVLRGRCLRDPALNAEVHYGGRRGLWIRRAQVRKWTYLLYHGHSIRSFAGIPWYGLFTRIGRWATTRKYGEFDAFACGHFHTCGYHKLNDRAVFMNGTAVTEDEWALETFGYASSNEWWLVGSSDRHPVTFQFPLTV